LILIKRAPVAAATLKSQAPETNNRRRIMQLPLQITVRDIPQSPALDELIREKAAKLETLHSRITSCRVVVSSEGRHRVHGRPIAVRVDLRVPDHEIVVTREHHEDAYVAVREAFEDTARQLQALVRRDRDASRAA
jgi:ribosomal subunit interface protein